MKIKRTVYHKEGYRKIPQEIEIELTPEELRRAFEEQEHEYDRQDILDVFDNLSDEEIAEIYGIIREDVTDMVEDMAYAKRRYIDKYDMHWDTARDEAIADTIVEYAKNGGRAE